ncbi:hypothetical protein BC831DRAFT_464433 [Entophlyctis helioformis]|nr:hypothetical protein BC831DRAFT_464433 [Entophlyctis helioformis]
MRMVGWLVSMPLLAISATSASIAAVLPRYEWARMAAVYASCVGWMPRDSMRPKTCRASCMRVSTAMCASALSTLKAAMPTRAAKCSAEMLARSGELVWLMRRKTWTAQRALLLPRAAPSSPRSVCCGSPAGAMAGGDVRLAGGATVERRARRAGCAALAVGAALAVRTDAAASEHAHRQPRRCSSTAASLARSMSGRVCAMAAMASVHWSWLATAPLPLHDIENNNEN